MKSQDASKMRRNILSGLLLALRINSDASIQDLLQIIRKPDLSAVHLAQSIRKQLETVSATCGSPASQLTEDDILSLGLADMLHNKAHTLISVQDEGVCKTETCEPATLQSVARLNLEFASVPSTDWFRHEASKNEIKPTLFVGHGDLQPIQTRGLDSRTSMSPISASLSVAASQFIDVRSYEASPVWDNQDNFLMDGTTDELFSEVHQNMVGAGHLSMISQDHSHLQFSWLPACRSH